MPSRIGNIEVVSKKSESLTVQYRPETTWNLNTKNERDERYGTNANPTGPFKDGLSLASGNRRKPGFERKLTGKEAESTPTLGRHR
jgi:hypothetical protein